MTPRELYEKYKGRFVKYSIDCEGYAPAKGIVVGYRCDKDREEPLIINVTNDGYGWASLGFNDIIVNKKNDDRYRYVSISDIVFKFGY